MRKPCYGIIYRSRLDSVIVSSGDAGHPRGLEGAGPLVRRSSGWCPIVNQAFVTPGCIAVITLLACTRTTMGATVWQRDDAGGKTFSMGGRTPGRPVAAPGKRKLVWTRDSQQPGSAEVAGTPNPSSAPAPVDDANPSKRRRSTTDSTPTAAKRAVPSHHRSNGRAAAQPSPSTAAASAGTARHPAAAAGETNDARPGTSATPPGLGLARQLQRKQSEMERLKQAMYAQQRKLHAEQVHALCPPILTPYTLYRASSTRITHPFV